MSRIDDLLTQRLDALASKASYAKKNRKRQYSQDMSAAIALALGEELRHRGMAEVMPVAPSGGATTGVERRMSGGIGAKRVDVSWSTEECGLLFAVSIKTINWKDGKTGNFQKNLTNRRGDMLFESVTLHRRFPFSALYGFLFLDTEAATDDTPLRASTFLNAHHRLRLFAGRRDSAGPDEQYEGLFIVLVDADPEGSTWECSRVGAPDEAVSLQDALDEAIELVATRNSDFYEVEDGTLRRV
jgi:hypothetical protein